MLQARNVVTCSIGIRRRTYASLPMSETRVFHRRVADRRARAIIPTPFFPVLFFFFLKLFQSPVQLCNPTVYSGSRSSDREGSDRVCAHARQKKYRKTPVRDRAKTYGETGLVFFFFFWSTSRRVCARERARVYDVPVLRRTRTINKKRRAAKGIASAE